MSTQGFFARTVLASSIALLAACGGGGGSSRAPSAPAQGTVTPTTTFSTTATVGSVGVPAFAGQSGGAPSVNIASSDLVTLTTSTPVNWKITGNGASLSIVGTNDSTHFSAKIVKPEGGVVTIVGTSAADPTVSITVTFNVALPLAKYQGVWRTCFTGYIAPGQVTPSQASSQDETTLSAPDAKGVVAGASKTYYYNSADCSGSAFAVVNMPSNTASWNGQKTLATGELVDELTATRVGGTSTFTGTGVALNNGYITVNYANGSSTSFSASQVAGATFKDVFYLTNATTLRFGDSSGTYPLDASGYPTVLWTQLYTKQ